MDIAPNNSVHFSEYTVKDLKSLYNYLSSQACVRSKENNIAIRDFKNGLKNCMYKIHYLRDYPFKEPINFSILSTDITNLPLYMNDKDPITASIARWRLFIGR